MAVEKRDRPKVLVVGSGLAGLTSAYLLRQEGCEVYLVEKVLYAVFASEGLTDV